MLSLIFVHSQLVYFVQLIACQAKKQISMFKI